MQDEIVTPAAALALKAGGPKTVLKVGSKQARTAEFEDEDVTAESLAAEISAEQSALAEKQGGCASRGRGGLCRGHGGRGGGSGGGFAAGAAPQNTRPCKICSKTHAGDQTESKCFQLDITAERKELDELEKHQTEMKERREKAHHHSMGFMKSQINRDSDYVVSVSQWLPSTRIPQSDYTTTTLSVQQSKRDATDPENGAAVDSASPIEIQTDPEFATLTAEPNLYLDGIVHCTTEVPQAICRFPTVDSKGKPVILETKGKGI
eukprot:3768595-Rhodomonas_salina.1